MKNDVKLSVFLIAFTILQSCGFHLRGSHQSETLNNLSPILLKGITRKSDFYDVAIRRLRSAKIDITHDKTAATAILTITKYRFRQQILTVDRKNKAAEYEVRLSLHFQFQQDQSIVKDTFFITRTYLSSGTDVLGKGFERQDIRKAMFDDALTQVLNRIAGEMAHKKIK